MNFYVKSLIYIWLLCINGLGVYAQEAKTVSAQLDEMLNSFFSRKSIGCAILVTKQGKIIYQKGFGQVDLELDKATTLKSVFRIGSLTKQFTAVAILQLYQDGKLGLDDDIRTYISDFPSGSEKITIENLLTHTSGIKNITEIEGLKIKQAPYTVEELISLFKNIPLGFRPGEKYEYSNSNYIALGYIIEKVSGLSYDRYLNKHFFVKLGMGGSSYDNPVMIIKNRAKGYDLDTLNNLVNALPLNTTFPYAAGGLIMSVGDYYKWHQALWGHKLLKKETLTRALTPYRLKDNTVINYGYGWVIGNLLGSKTYGHNGSTNGFQSKEIYLPREDILVVMFSNGSFINCTKVVDQAAAIVSKKKQLNEKIIDPLLAQKYTGTYKFSSDDPATLAIYKQGRKYFLKDSNASSAWEIHFTGDNEFICYEVYPNMHFFTKDRNGKVNYLVIKNFNYETKVLKVK